MSKAMKAGLWAIGIMGIGVVGEISYLLNEPSASKPNVTPPPLAQLTAGTVSPPATPPAPSISRNEMIDLQYVGCDLLGGELTKPILFDCATKAQQYAIDDASKEHARASFRSHMAPLIQPPTKADGPLFDVLVPSPNKGQCVIWGSMWSKDSADDLRSMGFQKIRCAGGKEWAL